MKCLQDLNKPMIMITAHMLSNSIFLFLQPTSILEVYSVISVQASQPTLKLWNTDWDTVVKDVLLLHNSNARP